MSLSSKLPPSWKLALKARLKQWRRSYAQRLRGFGPEHLRSALRALGIQRGDMVMLHSAFSAEHGFRGSAADLIDAMLDVLGPQGHLLMVTLPYRSAALDWLESGRTFDVRRTPSMMGMVSEVFRRRPGVVRSLHPTHPVAVHGPRAHQIVAAHPGCVHPCGPDTPFDEVAKADGKVVFFNVPIDTFTFFHYLEHLVSPQLPFGLYTDKVYDAPVVDAEGKVGVVRTHAFARDAIRRRRPQRLYDALWRGGKVARQKVGASQLLCVRVQDAIACTHQLQGDGLLFYDMNP